MKKRLLMVFISVVLIIGAFPSAAFSEEASMNMIGFLSEEKNEGDVGGEERNEEDIEEEEGNESDIEGEDGNQDTGEGEENEIANYDVEFICINADFFEVEVYKSSDINKENEISKEGSGKYLLENGEYVYLAKAEGFEDYEGSFSVENKALEVEFFMTKLYEFKFICSEENFEAVVYDSAYNYYEDLGGIYLLKDGTYSFDITKEGFCDYSGTFEISGENKEVSVELKEGKDVIFNIDFAEGIDAEFSPYSVSMYITGCGWANLKSDNSDNKLKYCLSDGEYTYSAYYYYDWNNFDNYYYCYGEFTVSGESIEEDVLLGYTVTFNTNPSGAVITVYDAGKKEIKGYYGRYGLESGEYTYKAENDFYDTAEGSFTVENEGKTIDVLMNRTDDSEDELKRKFAYFALKGDAGLWIEKSAVEIKDGMTAFDVVEEVLEKKGYTLISKNSYISAVKTPDGEILGEGDLGVNSGWMYSINDVIVSYSLSEMEVMDDDFIYLFFTLDYTLEKYPEDFSSDDNLTAGAAVQNKEELEKEEEILEISENEKEEVLKIDPISFVIEKGLFKGVSENNFGEEENMTRAMLAAVLHRLDGEEKVDYKDEFEDTDEESWYTDSIEWAADKGIMSGYSQNKFGPNDVVTNAQAASVFYRYLLYKGIELSFEKEMLYASENAPEYAKLPLSWACKEGIIDIEENWGSNVSRLECAEMLMLIGVKYSLI